MFSRFADGAEDYVTPECRWVIMVGESYSPSVATFANAMDALRFYDGCVLHQEAGRLTNYRTSYLPDICLYFVPEPKPVIVACKYDDEIPF